MSGRREKGLGCFNARLWLSRAPSFPSPLSSLFPAHLRANRRPEPEREDNAAGAALDRFEREHAREALRSEKERKLEQRRK